MCEPKTAKEAAGRYWFNVGIGEINGLTEFCLRQRRMVEGAFAAGVEWRRAQEVAKVNQGEEVRR